MKKAYPHKEQADKALDAEEKTLKAKSKENNNTDEGREETPSIH